MKKPKKKRIQFDATPELLEEIDFLSRELGISATADVIRESLELLALLTSHAKRGERIFLGSDATSVREILIGKIAHAAERRWSKQDDSTRQKK